MSEKWKVSWIHCTGCLNSITDALETFYMTNCHHSFCKSCLSKLSKPLCPLCSKKISMTKALNGPKRDDFLRSHVENIDDKIKGIVEAQSFQEKINSELLEYLKNGFTSLAGEIKKISESLERETTHGVKLKIHNKRLRKRLKELEGGYPATTPQTKFRREAQCLFSPIKSVNGSENASYSSRESNARILSKKQKK